MLARKEVAFWASVAGNSYYNGAFFNVSFEMTCKHGLTAVLDTGIPPYRRAFLAGAAPTNLC